MFTLSRAALPSLCLLLLAGGLLVVGHRQAHSFPDESRAPAKWEYSTATVELGSLPGTLNDLGGQGWEVFSVWLSAFLHARGDEIFRIKGVVRTPNGRVLLQCVQKSVLPPEILPEVEAGDRSFDNRLAFIGRGFDAERLARSLKSFCCS